MSRSTVVGSTFVAVSVLLIAAPSYSDPQPGSFLNPTESQLLSLARKACTGVLDKDLDLPNALKIEAPIHVYMEEKPPENLSISVRHCPAPSAYAEFVIGHINGKNGYFYKISPQQVRILEVAHSFIDQRSRVAIEPVAPETQAGAIKVYSKHIQDDFKQLLDVVLARWGQ